MITSSESVAKHYAINPAHLARQKIKTHSGTMKLNYSASMSRLRKLFNTKCVPQFFLLPRIPCRKTAVGGSGDDLSITLLHFTCSEHAETQFNSIVPQSMWQQYINFIHLHLPDIQKLFIHKKGNQIAPEPLHNPRFLKI